MTGCVLTPPLPHPRRRQSYRDKAEPGSPAALAAGAEPTIFSHEEEMAGRLFDQMASSSIPEDVPAAGDATEAAGAKAPATKVATVHTSAFAKVPESDLDSLVNLPGQGARPAGAAAPCRVPPCT